MKLQEILLLTNICLHVFKDSESNLISLLIYVVRIYNHYEHMLIVLTQTI